ncbi:MAG: 50S ribosomal protein L4 [Planctomycetes bacterium]|nr:50S ribosomal protein L4 [Planctomycetota bacterium]
MTTLPVFDRTGAEVGTYEIDPAALSPRINKQLLHDVIVMYQTNRRQGSAHTKSRGQVAGSTRKMYRQKGTGNARAGSRRSNIRVGGGRAFAKQARDYSYRLPRKAIRAATRMALASKIVDQQLVVIDDLSFPQPATGEMAAILQALGLGGLSTLVATAALDVNVFKSARNIPGVTVAPVSDLNALSVLSPRRLLVTKAALDSIKEKSVA